MSKIIGLPCWDDQDAYYSQTNNVVESVLVKTGANRKLESCGPTSAVMLMAALGLELKNLRMVTVGGWEPQPEDMLACWMNDPRNYNDMRRIRNDIDPANIMGNEVPQWYEVAIPAVFGVPARFRWGASINEIRDALVNCRGVLITLEKPGHYIAIVADDLDSGEFVYHDPWPGNTWPADMAGKPGAGRRVKYAELMANVKPYRVEVGA